VVQRAGLTQVTPTPGDRFSELERIGGRIASEGPTLVTEPEIYAGRHFLREADPEGAGDLRVRQIPLSAGQTLGNGAWADIDAFFPSSLAPYDTLVIRRSPVASRPPHPYRLTHRGRWYETWQRPGKDAGGLVEHDGLGDNFSRPYCAARARQLHIGVGPAAALGVAEAKTRTSRRCSATPPARPSAPPCPGAGPSSRRRRRS